MNRALYIYLLASKICMYDIMQCHNLLMETSVSGIENTFSIFNILCMCTCTYATKAVTCSALHPPSMLDKPTDMEVIVVMCITTTI